LCYSRSLLHLLLWYIKFVNCVIHVPELIRSLWGIVMTKKPTYEELEQQILEFKSLESERKQAEELLRESEEKFKTSAEFFKEVTENTSDIILIVDKMGIFKYASPSIERFLGYQPEELIDMSIFKYIHLADVPRALLDFGKAILTKEIAVPNSFRVLHKDGSERVLEGTGKNQLKNPAIAGFIMNIHDTTERKQAEVALSDSEEKYRLIVENANDGIEITQDDKFIYTNKRFAEMLGYTVKAVKNKPFSEFFTEQGIKDLYERQKKRKRNNSLIFGYETTFYKKDGSIIDVEIKAEIIDFQGKPATFAIVRDITESKQAAEKLQRAYQLQTVLYQIAEATSVEKDLEALCRSIHNYLGSVLDVTNFYIALQKTEGGNLVFPYYVDEEDSSPGTVEFGNGLTEYVIKSGKSTFARMEDIYRMHNQGEIELLGTPSKLWLGVPLHLNGRSVGAIVVQSYKDENLYTESHLKVLEYVSSQIADALFHKQAEEQLAESDNLKGLLLDIITHDLRNPAASIFSFSEIAQKNSPGNKIIDLIHFSSEQLIKVLESTTVLTQAMFGEKIPKEELNLNDVLSGVASEFKLRLSEFKMSLDMNIQQSMVIYANPLISEIFKNYISNAIKYARDGEKILVEAVEEDESILVSVKDFGKTIPEKNRMHVFERNVQLAKENKRGRGLGLAIVKRIAAAHDGEVWVEPNTPRGNSFCLRIPR